VDEARRVLARLERIEALDRRRAVPGQLLAELRALLTEAEDWARAEGGIPAAATDAVERCRGLLGPAEPPGSPELLGNPSRTLLA